MNTIRIKCNNAKDFYIFEPLFKQFNVKVYNDTEDIKEKDESSMSEKEYFAMIDRARAEKKHEISREDMRKMLMGGLKNEFAANA